MQGNPWHDLAAGPEPPHVLNAIIEIPRGLDHFDRPRAIPPPDDRRPHTFELLVDREEVLHLAEVMPRDVAQVVVLVVEGIAERHAQDLLVLPLLVLHLERADRAYLHQTAGKRGDRHHDQHVERVLVVRQRLRDEPVVARVVDRAVEQPVELQ